MFPKFMSVAFLSIIKISLFLQEPALIPIRKKKNEKRVQQHLFFLHFLSLKITIAMSITNNISNNVRMMYVDFTV